MSVHVYVRVLDHLVSDVTVLIDFKRVTAGVS